MKIKEVVYNVLQEVLADPLTAVVLVGVGVLAGVILSALVT